MRHARPVAIALAITVFALLPSASALASKSATPSQTRALTRAIRTTAVAGIDKIPTNRYRVSRVRISTVSKAWATASLLPTKLSKDTFQSSYVVAVNLAGTSSWAVVDVGSAEVGCGVAPDSVLADLLGLKAGEQPCPPGEGIS
jgi:hypothetical protein